MANQSQNWQTVIGLEIHAALNTQSKLFSAALNHFGDEPNVNITEVCTGMPGALPVLNREAVRKAVQFGCAIEGTIAKYSKFDRKSYFYPDNPRNFQITQYDEPIIIGGKIVAEIEGVERCFEISRVHLEEDAAMLKHFPNFAGVDFNRAGVPLIEIVSEPCIHTPQEAVAYAVAVKAILEYVDASDCNMEEGSFRIDANISVRKHGEVGLRNRVEIKNMNSFSYLEMALEAEVKRQIKAYTHQPDVPFDQVIRQTTCRWDSEKKEVIAMRRKEDAEDYRYFPEPDLMPIILTEQYIQAIRQALPELPLQRKRRYVAELGLSPQGAFVITSEKALADYFEMALSHCSNARSLCNWITVEFAGRMKGIGRSLVQSGIPAKHVGALIEMIENGMITGRIAKAVADEMVLQPSKEPKSIVTECAAYRPLREQAEIELLVDKVLAENPQPIADYREGREKAFAFLVGLVMKLSHGQAAPQVVNTLLHQKIGC